MEITEAFRNAVSDGNVQGIRIMMKNSLLVDLTFDEFDEMDRLAQNVKGLYDNHDGRDIITDRFAWNDGYMSELMVQVVGNFSRKRVNHLKEVVRHLRPVATQKQTASSKQSSSTINTGAKIAIGVVAVGCVGAAVSGVAGTSVIAGAVIGGALGGVLGAVTKTK